MPSPNPSKDIALNIVALSVFALTLTSLVGPLMNVSPLLPSVFLFGLLVLTSLDSFFYQSRLADLVTDSIARRNPAYVERIVYHEAGHFLVAQLSEITVTGYVLSAWEAWRQGQVGRGGVAFAPPPSVLTSQQLDAYCMVWMAGIAAEKLVYGDSQGGSDDQQKLRGMLTLAGFDAGSLRRAEDAALLKANQFLVTHRATLDALVVALNDRQSIAFCCALVQSNNAAN
jgi:hypothetical protein